MNITAVGLILIVTVIACSIHSSVAAAFGDACTDDSNCTETGQMCNNTCVCYSDNDYTRVGDKCVKELGTYCTIAAACNDVNVICDNSNCQCNKSLHYDDNGDTSLGGSCIAKHALGVDCLNPIPNVEQCLTSNAVCTAVSGGTGGSGHTCQCNVGYYNSGGNCVQATWGTWGDLGTCSVSCGDGTQTRTRTCTPSGATCSPGLGSQEVSCNLGSCERSIGETCTDTTQCSTLNSQCIGSGTKTCTCKPGYLTVSNSCLKRSIDETCTETTQCSTLNSQCIGSGTKTCTCKPGYLTVGNSCLQRSIDETCTETTQCSTLNSQCIGSGTKTCTCKPGYLTVGNSCLKRYLGESCSETTHCSLVDNSQCSGGFCECKSDYYKTANGLSGRCEKRHLDESCTADSQCTEGNSECRDNKCLCKSGYYQMGTGSTGTCTERHLDQSCNDSPQCQEANSECSNNRCSCKNGYYQSGTGSTGTCTRQSLGGVCTDSSQCSTSNAECSSGGTRICQCSNEYYDTNGAASGGSCTSKLYVGRTCPQPTESVPNTATCRDNNARCMPSGSSFTCQCISNYYDNMNNNIYNRQCILRRVLGDSCSGTSYTLDQCSDSSATCSWESGTYKCKCNTGYHQEQQQCMANKALGETCNLAATEAECSDPAAVCLNGKCTCNTKSYDSNGLQNAGTCMPISNLQVSNVGFSNIQNDQITVTWTTPQTYKQFINKFNVTWRPTNNNNVNTELADLTSSSTSYTMTQGIDPGRAYTVTIISINDQTQQGSQRNTSVVRYQAAKPSITSGIDNSNSDKDISDGTIKVAWINAPGYKSGYIVELKDGEIVKFTRTVNGVSVTLSSSGLKNGYNYVVTIQAKSEQFDNGKTELGQIYTFEYKTTPKSPEPPRNGVCKDPTDSTISLDWEAPTNPNGDLVQYNIHVFKHNSLVFNNVTSTGTQTNKIVGNLEPGTSYTFSIYTENEVGQSTTALQVSSTNCKTRARMSTKPENLQITDVLSRSFLITWDKPLETYSDENYGYVLQVKDDEGACKEEVLYKCSDCKGSFQVSELSGLCDQNKQPDFTISEAKLASQLSYNASLNPDTDYTVTVTAINDEGRGHPATMSQITKEEAPQTPYDVKVVGMTATTFDITWSINGPRPGHTTYVIMLTADTPAESKNFTATGFDMRQYTATGLQEFWNYSVSVMASTSVSSSKSAVTNKYMTSTAAPGKVSQFKIDPHPDGDYTKMTVSWQMPTILERNGIIKSYNFEYFETTMVTSNESFGQKTAEEYLYSKTIDVKPEKTYNITVYAINKEDMIGEKHSVERDAPAGAPPNIEETENATVVPKTSVKNVEKTSFTVAIKEQFFINDTYGAIMDNGLAICTKKDCDVSDIKKKDDFSGMEDIKKNKNMYRLTRANWLVKLREENEESNSRKRRAIGELEYTVGEEDCSKLSPNEFCNGPLQPGTTYFMFGVACTNGGCLVSQPYGPFITEAEPEEKANLGLIIGIVVACVVIIVLVAVIAVLLLRRRKRHGDGMKPSPGDDDDDDFTKLDPSTANIKRKRPINLNEIEEYVGNMHKDSNLLFSAEYEELKTLSPKHACEAADREENRMRNRYINIIPFDHSRVKLSTNGEDDSADYINGNYLPGYNSPREYIGCQGPIPGTIDDFWRMTWEQNVSVIVMLTLCKEGQKIKCEQYWPDEVGEPKQYGDVIVEITSYSNIRTYDYRMFRITNGSTTRVVKHFHFLSWLDFQANVHHDIILDFIQHVRQHVQPPDTSGPMIIHCSAGVGRTGTYIALDHLMQFINEHDFDVEIDIFDLVLKLRENRQHMVQTEQQYVFIHDCVKEIMERKRRQMENIYENQGFSQDENIYQNEQSLYANVSISKAEQNTEL